MTALTIAMAAAWCTGGAVAADPPPVKPAAKKPARAWSREKAAKQKAARAEKHRRLERRDQQLEPKPKPRRPEHPARPPHRPEGPPKHHPDGPPPRPHARPERGSIDARVAALERQVRELRQEVERLREMPPPPPGPRGPRGPERPLSPPQAREREQVRVYRLPKGKLDALWELLARDDVPVPVERVPDGIAVHAPPQQQRIVAAFIRLIAPEATPQAQRPQPRGPRDRPQPRRDRRFRPERPHRVPRILSQDEGPPPGELLEALHAQLKARMRKVEALRDRAEQAMREAMEQLNDALGDLDRIARRAD